MVSIKCHYNRVMLIPSCTVWGCVHTTVAELGSHNIKSKVSGPLQKTFANSCPRSSIQPCCSLLRILQWLPVALYKLTPVYLSSLTTVSPVVCPLWTTNPSSNLPQTTALGLSHAFYLYSACLSPPNGSLPSQDSAQMLPSVFVPHPGVLPLSMRANPFLACHKKILV